MCMWILFLSFCVIPFAVNLFLHEIFLSLKMDDLNGERMFCGDALCNFQFCWCLWNFPEFSICGISLWNSFTGASAISVCKHMMTLKFISEQSAHEWQHIQNYCFDAKSCKIFWCEREWKGKCDFHVKTRWIPSPTHKKTKGLHHRQHTKNERWKLHLQFRASSMKNFISTLVACSFCVLVGSFSVPVGSFRSRASYIDTQSINILSHRREKCATDATVVNDNGNKVLCIRNIFWFNCYNHWRSFSLSPHKRCTCSSKFWKSLSKNISRAVEMTRHDFASAGSASCLLCKIYWESERGSQATDKNP